MSAQAPAATQSLKTTSDLRSFYDFVGEQLRRNEPCLTPAEVFEEWLLLQPDDGDDCDAIQQALDEMDAGDQGTPWEAFDAAFRQKHQLPPRS